MNRAAPLRDGLLIALLGLIVRLGVVLWGSGRFPPSEDGRFYHTLARRIAAGEGYSWLWPDGVVTPVTHYPVGYPGIVAALYAGFGSAPWVAMSLNAVLGAVGVLAAHQVASRGASRRGAALAALLVAAHPGLVLYTPAVMTEGVSAALLAVGAWLCVLMAESRKPIGWTLGAGIVFGLSILVRPQFLLLAPVFALVGARTFKAAVLRSVAVSSVALACVLPWTVRNCRSMDQCVFVSANAGWNLWIGAPPHATGTFLSVAGDTVPVDCRTVFPEVQKDRCFGSAAWRNIAKVPGDWLALVPKKLSHTFDYCGAAGWYLRAANPGALSEKAKWGLGAVETLFQRIVLLFALLSLARPGPRRRLRQGLVGCGVVALLTPYAWLSYAALALAASGLGRRLLGSPPAFLASTAVLATALTHAVFFGAGRYGMVTFVVLAALSGSLLTARPEPGDTSIRGDTDGCP